MKKSFIQYDKENPQIWEAFQRYAGQLRATGRKRIGAKLIMERIRWDSAIGGHGDFFKINNNYTAGYARKMIEYDPDFATLFQTRENKGQLEMI